MRPATDDEFEELLTSFGREAVHLEMRDAYGTAVELPYMAKWERGEPGNDFYNPHSALGGRAGSAR